MAWLLDEAGYVTGTYYGPGQPANSTTVPPPADAATPLQFVDGAWLVSQTASKRITLLAFYSRFTSDERLAVRVAQARDMVVADFMMLVGAATFIDLDADDTQNGIAYLVSTHLLTTERAAAILGAAITDAERP